jgi:cation:H+ antiporter
MVAGVLLVVSLAVMLAGAVVFTNAVEWAGARLHLGHSAVGSVLAAAATVLPEALIFIVAVARGRQGNGIAVGAIAGAPFLLATLALALCGVSAVVFRGRRGSAQLLLGRHESVPDLLVVVCALAVSVAIGVAGAPALRFAGASVLLAAYAAVTWRSVSRARQAGGAGQPASLYFGTARHDPPPTVLVAVQTLAGAGLLAGAAELYVRCVGNLAGTLGASALTLTLVIAPLATELPEQINSVLWIREGKDVLALGNITGAMVLQCTLLVAAGMAFTDWQLTAPALLAMLGALAGAALGLTAALRARRLSAPVIGCWAGMYLGGITSIIALT